MWLTCHFKALLINKIWGYSIVRKVFFWKTPTNLQKIVHSYSKLLIFTLGLKWSLWASGIHSRGNEWCILIFRLPIVLLTHLLATIQVFISLKLEWLAYLWLKRPKQRSQCSYMLLWELGCLLFGKYKTRLQVCARLQAWSQRALQSQSHDQRLRII